MSRISSTFCGVEGGGIGRKRSTGRGGSGAMAASSARGRVDSRSRGAEGERDRDLRRFFGPGFSGGGIETRSRKGSSAAGRVAGLAGVGLGEVAAGGIGSGLYSMASYADTGALQRGQ